MRLTGKQWAKKYPLKYTQLLIYKFLDLEIWQCSFPYNYIRKAIFSQKPNTMSEYPSYSEEHVSFVLFMFKD